MSAYSDSVLADSPALYWRLGEPSGTNANDETANNRDGTYTGCTLGLAGPLAGDADTAVTLDGVDDWIGAVAYVPGVNGTQRTFEGWAKRTGAGTGLDTLFRTSGGRLYSEGNQVKFEAASNYNGGGIWNAAWPGSDQWVHWVLTFDESTDTCELYINGVSKGTRTETHAWGASDVLYVGRGLSGSTNWKGGVDEIAVYESILSAARVLAHYEAGITEPPTHETVTWETSYTVRERRTVTWATSYDVLSSVTKTWQSSYAVETPPPFQAISVREKPPLRHTIGVETPVGKRYRWALDEPDPADVFSGLRYTDTMPGGHEHCDCVLPRDPRIDYADMERLSNMLVEGPGGEPYWEGRLERAAQSSGDQIAIAPGAVGHVAHLDDNKFALMVYVDGDLNHWKQPSSARQIAALPRRGTWEIGTADRVATEQPALLMKWDQLAAADNRVEAWYVSPVELGSIHHELAMFGATAPDVNWEHEIWQSDDDAGTTIAQITTDPDGVGQPLAETAIAAGNLAVFLYGNYVGAFGGDGLWGAAWKYLKVFGRHGLTKRTSVPGGPGTPPDYGFYASDIVAHAVATWAPLLNVYDDSIQQSSFIIEQAAFLDPTTASEIVRQASRFELPDWAVWDDREFVWHEPGARGRTWLLRTGPSGLEAAGQTVERLWESIVVQYQDVDGSTRTVGPPGSGADTESADLKDDDPDNPANKVSGMVRRDLLVMQTSTAGGAIEIGRRFLEHSKLLDTSGKAKVVGWAQDDRGVLHPFSAIRSGDYAVFVDARDTSPRKIVRTEKDFAGRTCSLDLDAPPEGLQQLLERLNVALVRLGLA